MTELTSRPHLDESENQRGRVRRIAAASTSARLRRAQEDLRRAEKQRNVSDRAIGHAAIGSGAIAVFVALLTVIGSLAGFAFAIVALYVGLRSFTFAISIRLGDPWGWTRDAGLSTPLAWSDHVALAGVRWLRRRAAGARGIPANGAVRVQPPASTE